MARRKMYQLLICVVAFFSNATAQITTNSNSVLSENFRCEVKSIDEFGARFNGIEFHPDVPEDSLALKHNLFALFDIESFIEQSKTSEFQERVIAFCDSILGHNVRFSLTSGGVFAYAECIVTYNKRECRLFLTLRQELTESGYTRWGISSVNGLSQNHIISDKLYNISPVEHEIHFMGLNDIFNENPQKAFECRASSSDIDPLSVFMTLIYTKTLKFNLVEHLSIYCLDVPGFIFKISECVRDSHNSGWLITELIPATAEEKICYVNQLIHD